MQTILVNTFEALEPFRDQWDQMAQGNPFRLWDWNAQWWRHYESALGESAELRLLCVFDHQDRLAGVAPWYAVSSTTSGEVLRFLGDGEVCSDYQGILCRPENQESVLELIVYWLLGTDRKRDPIELAVETNQEKDPIELAGGVGEWDLLDCDGMAQNDPVMNQWTELMQREGASIYQRSTCSFWATDLPESMEVYYQNTSKNHRKRVKRLLRQLESDRFRMSVLETADQIDPRIETLIRLHQKRQNHLGNPGCFASPPYTAFHREMIHQLFRTGNLQLHTLEYEGQPIAIQYELLGTGTIYAYQGGIDPDFDDLGPGHLLQASVLRWAIENGFRRFDWLRGDEPYKKHWQAQPTASLQMRIIPPRLGPQCRQAVWAAGRGAKDWLKRRLETLSLLNN